MQLSSELFERIVGVAAPPQPVPAASDVVSPAGARVMDRRAATRIPFGARAKITYENPEQAGLTDTVMLQDISVLGVSFVSAEWIALEEVLVVHIKDQQDQELRLRCKVQRCEQGGYGGVSYIVGTVFLELLENTAGHSADGGAAVAASRKTAVRKRRAASPPPGFSGRWKKLNPLRLFGSRNFDDFTAVGEGSKPSRELLEQQEAEEEESPAQAPIAAKLTDSEPTKPRKSSIFLRPEPQAQKPVQETAAPQTREESELQELEPEVAAVTPSVEAEESPSISADDIAAILGAIPMETSAVSEMARSEPPIAAVVVESTVADAPPTPPVVAIPESMAVQAPEPAPTELAKVEPVVIEPTAPLPTAVVIPEPAAIQLPLSSLPAAMSPEPVAISEPTPPAPTAIPEPVAISSQPPSPAPVKTPALSAADITAIMNSIPVAMPAGSDQSSSESLAGELSDGTPSPTQVAVCEVPAANPEPAAVEFPAPVVAEPVAIEAPAPVVVEPVAIESPAPMAVVNPEPAAIELPTPMQRMPVEVVKAEPEKIELPAASSAAVKDVAVEVEQAEKLAEEVEVAEEVENAVKTAAPNSSTVKFRFTEKSLPSYLSNPESIEDLVPWLSFNGVGVGELPAAFAHLGFEGSDATAMNVLQMKDAWAEEYRAWGKRDLHGKRYVYMWADGLEIGGGPDGVLVIIGAGEKGERELIAVGAGQRENPDSWIALLADLKNRGLTRPPKLFIGDAKLGLWKPLSTLSPTTRQQRCWRYKSADVLRDLPVTLHPYATAKLDEISMAARREVATKPLELFSQICGAESPAAAQCLLADKDNLLTFHDFPAEHWTHLRNTNVIDGIFNTLNLKGYSVEGAFAREQAIIMAFKLAQLAQKQWRKLGASPLLSDLLRGATFIDGVKAAA